MNQHTTKRWLCSLALAAIGFVVILPRPSSAQDDPNPAGDPNVQVLTRGPVHEAFAEPVSYDPRPGLVIPKEPPPPVEEIPPDQKPAGNDVQWIPGYWSWDDGRNDFIWISGVWRDIPPGRHWVPGYWDPAEGGFRWVPGYWAPDQVEQAQYLSAPPESLDSGPNSPPPSADATWVPGYWAWQDNRYAWRPGYWVPFQPDWVWVPPHYNCAPSGYLFVDGYWDRPILQRGTLFAPVYYQQPLYRQQNYVYTPSVSLLTSALVGSLFVRPSNNHYYFGDYYASNNFQAGYIPWSSYHQSRYGYDPIYSQFATVNTRRDPNWQNDQHEVYRYRREHPEARPPQTYVQQQAFLERNNVTNTSINNFSNSATNVRNIANVQNFVVARPVNQVAANPNAPGRFERINQERRQEFARRATQLHQYGVQRSVREDGIGRLPANVAPQPVRPPTSNEFRPRQVPLPTSPIASAPPTERIRNLPQPERNRFIPPAQPVHPQPVMNIQPAPPGQAPRRFEPHPDHLPPPMFRPAAPVEHFRQVEQQRAAEKPKGRP